MTRKKQIIKNRRDSKKTLYKRVAYAAVVLLLLIGTIVLSIVIDKSSPVFTLSIESDLTDNAAKQLCQMIEEKPYISDVRYLTKEEVLEQESDKLGFNPSEGLGMNPYLPLIDIRLKTKYVVPDSFPNIEADLMSLPTVTEVTPPDNFMTMHEDMDNLRTRVLFLRGLALVLGILFVWMSVSTMRKWKN